MDVLATDFDSLMAVMEGNRPNRTECYLDLISGEVVTISQKVLDAIEAEDCQTLNHLPDTQRKEIKIAADILGPRSDQFALVPELSTSDILQFMKDFAAQLDDVNLRVELGQTLQGKGAMKRFLARLSESASLAAQWSQFKRNSLAERLRSWLHEQGFGEVVDRPHVLH